MPAWAWDGFAWIGVATLALTVVLYGWVAWDESARRAARKAGL